MAAPAYFIKHGSGALITRASVRKRLDGFDEGSFSAHSDSENTYAPGSAMPGYTGLYIAECDNEYDGDEFLHDIRAQGLVGVSSRLISSEYKESDDGFDVGTERWIVAKGGGYGLGASAQGHSYLKCVSAPRSMSPVPQFEYQTLEFKGILTFGRANRIRVETVGREFRRDNLIVRGAGGWSTAQSGEILWGRTAVTESYLTTAAPNTARIPAQGGNPTFRPSITNISFTTSDATVYHWPNGWTLSALSFDRVLNFSLYYVTEYWLYNPKITW